MILEGATIQSLSGEAARTLRKLQRNRKHVLLGDRFYTTSFNAFKQYSESLRENIKSLHFLGAKTTDAEVDLSTIKSIYLIGHDREHNSYWEAEEEQTEKLLVLIYSKVGTLLDAFYFNTISRAKKGDERIRQGLELRPEDERLREPAVALNGDVYFMSDNRNGYYFEKVERRW